MGGGQGNTAPPGAGFVYDAASKALDDQLSWADTLDTKTGVLIAADGVLVGLLFTRDSLLFDAPAWVAGLSTTFLLLSVGVGLWGFRTRTYQTPAFEALCELLGKGDDEFLKSKALADVREAHTRNEPILDRKAWEVWLTGVFLLSGAATLGLYLLYSIFS